MTILCHVSDKKVYTLEPQEPTGAICFSEDKFITYFGEYLYLFDLATLQENFRIEKLPTTGLYHTQYLPPEGKEVIQYRSKSLEYEWRVYDCIPVDEFALGMLEHWNHMEGFIGKGSVESALHKMTIDLMSYDIQNYF